MSDIKHVIRYQGTTILFANFDEVVKWVAKELKMGQRDTPETEAQQFEAVDQLQTFLNQNY